MNFAKSCALIAISFGFLFFSSPSVLAAAPDFASLGAVSNNADATWAKSGDTITFTLTLNVAEDSDGTGVVTFDAGASTGLTANFPVAASSTTHTATYAVPGGVDGAISVTGLTFTNTDPAAIVSVPGFPFVPTPNVTIDTTAPVLSGISAVSNNANTIYAKAGDSVTFTLTLATADTWMPGNTLNYSIGAGASTPLPSAFVSTAGVATKTSGTRSVSVVALQNGTFNIDSLSFTDRAGNAITGFVAGTPIPNVTADTTAPTITGVVQSTDNPYRDKWAKAGEFITYDITFAEDVSATVNVPSSAINVTTLSQEVDVFKTNTDQLIFAPVGGDNGVVTVSVDFDITDNAGNVTNITSLGAITSADGSAPVETDTTLPTLTSVGISSDNTNTAWAKTGDTITIATAASEKLRSGISETVSGTISTEAATLNNLCGAGINCQTHQFSLLTDGNEAEGVVPFALNFQDRAGNAGVAVTATTDASSVTFDKTAPTVPLVSIASNNALNTALAKSNDTITVTFTVADNLATTASISGAPTILSSAAVNTVTTVAAGQTISRFTDGSETSEVIVPFSFAVQDQAGNISATITATTDASQVQFDRTDPIVSNVGITATSADLSAFTGDAPTYYAKQGDTLDLVLQICDYVDSNSNPPTGTIFGLATVFVDQGLVGAPGNCVTGAGNLSQFREWKGTVLGIDGVEGTVPFSVDGKDNAGNVLVPSVTGTTNGSSVIFDKTVPLPPTDMVDLGGAATAGYKPAPNAALYTWTNDSDPAGGAPVSGVYQFDVRYNNVNTGINEMVTITQPTRTFAPTLMIPDLAPYTVNMAVRDKAGNTALEAIVYTQKYGVEVSGKVTDTDTGDAIEGAYINAIAPAGSDCNFPGQEVCSAATDANGDYVMTVAPNTNYKLDGTKTPTYYIAKSDLSITTADVVSNISLKHVAEGEIQTGNQGTVITTDAVFQVGGLDQTTYITAYSQSGEVTTKITAEGIEITSFGTVTGVTSNNPDVVIQDKGNNTFLVKNAGSILNVSDNKNRGSSVSSSYASGSNGVGIRRAVGGANAGFQVGMKRGDRVVNGKAWTHAESRAFAKQLNQGTSYKVMQYLNRNGYMVFAGYRHGRMAMADMAGSNPNLKLNKQVVYRGPRRGTEATFRKVDIEDRKEVVQSLFKQVEGEEPKVLVVEEGNQQKAARPVVETKKTELAYDNPEITGFGRPDSVYPGVYNKRENDARYVNKYARAQAPATVAPSRMTGKNVNMIVFKRGSQRSGKKLVLGQLFNDNPQLITKRERVVRR